MKATAAVRAARSSSLVRCLAIFGWEMNTAIACNIRVIISDGWYCVTLAGMDTINYVETCYCGTLAHCYRGTALHGEVLMWYLCHVGSMHGSVIGVGRVISRLDEAKEGMAVGRVKVEVADQTWEYQVGEVMVTGVHVQGQEL